MYEVTDIQEYRNKWLEAERELMLIWFIPDVSLVDYEPVLRVL